MATKRQLPSLIEESILAAEIPVGAEDARKLAFNSAKDVSDVRLYKQRLAMLDAIRRPMLDIWKDVRDFLLPECGKYLDGDEDIDSERYGVDYSNILDSSPAEAARVATSGLHGGLTSPSVQWFTFYLASYLGRDDFDESASQDSKDWVYNSQLATRDVLFSGNFYAAIQAFYKEVLGFGTAAVMISEDWDTVARFYPLTVGSYWLGQGSDLRINTLYRKHSATARDIVETYGRENCPECVLEAVRKSRNDQRFYIIQAVQPWNFFGNHKPHADYRYEDVRFLENSTDSDPILFLGGYTSRPFVAARWDDVADNIYGRSCPGMMTLPDNKQIQVMTKFANMASEWDADPAMAVPAAMKEKPITPGTLIPYNGDPKNAQVIPIVNNRFDYNVNLQRIQYLNQRVANGFYNQLFTMIQNRSRQMTATEVQQLVEEKSALLGPVVMQLTSEALTPMLDRTFEIILRRGLLTAPPEGIAGRDIRPYFTSSLAIAQRQASGSGMDRAVQSVGFAMQIDPAVGDILNLDNYVRAKAETDEVPSEMIRAKKEVEELRAARAQQQQQMAQAQAMKETAATAKTLGDTPVNEHNALGMMLAQGVM